MILTCDKFESSLTWRELFNSGFVERFEIDDDVELNICLPFGGLIGTRYAAKPCLCFLCFLRLNIKKYKNTDPKKIAAKTLHIKMISGVYDFEDDLWIDSLVFTDSFISSGLPLVLNNDRNFDEVEGVVKISANKHY